ncbi:60S ribosomal protein L6-B [Penicillium manginii]|uniref:60S ribosomal protein L6-B n=1 Tax=Penicillium manginii TaxID=203109 RepID=UPI00254912F7|nr:60S ribosomal protein L6-B [Penicillium manginii]KAJ5744984.1 60S ribosomal protein L6-B [Penicillium manginii]
MSDGQTKQFGKGQRTVPAQKAQKWYPVDDESQPKKVSIPRKSTWTYIEKEIRTCIDCYGWMRHDIRVRKTLRPAKVRESLQPGTVLILLAGRFRGKRVVLLKHLEQGVLLVTGPFKINGVPLRRVNSRYVIATSKRIDVSGVDAKAIEKISAPEYFTKEKKAEKKSEEAFFKQGEKPQKKVVASARAADQKAVDQSILGSIKKEEFLSSYLASTFSLRNGDKPHEMKW